MPRLQLTYASRPFGYDGAMLQGVLMDARRCNLRDRITGALICRDDLFLQLLEGPEAAVEQAGEAEVLAIFARLAAGPAA